MRGDRCSGTSVSEVPLGFGGRKIETCGEIVMEGGTGMDLKGTDVSTKRE